MERLDATWNESPNHIPVGLYLDLIDSGIEPVSSLDGVFIDANTPAAILTTVVDNVSGFTNQQMFQCLNSSITGVGVFKTTLLNNYLNSTNNTVQDVDALFNSY